MVGLTQRQQMVLDYIRQSIVDRGYPPTLREIGARMGIRSTNGVNDHLRALERKGYLTREDMKSRALRPLPSGVLPFGAALTAISSSNGNLNGAKSNGLGLADHGRSHDARQPSLPGLADGLSDDHTHFSSAPPANDDDMIDVPILGRVAAGLPLLAEEQVIDTVRIDRGLLKGGREVFGLRVQGDSMIDAGILSGDYIFVRKEITAERGEIVVALIGDEATVKYYFPEKDYVRFQPANKTMAPILVRAVDFRSTMLLGVVVGVFRRV
jgi:repressor LexA